MVFTVRGRDGRFFQDGSRPTGPAEEEEDDEGGSGEAPLGVDADFRWEGRTDFGIPHTMPGSPYTGHGARFTAPYGGSDVENIFFGAPEMSAADQNSFGFFGRMSPESIREVQAMLIAAGLLSDGANIVYGSATDGPTQTAMRKLLGIANQYGAPWDVTLRQLVSGRQPSGGGGGGRGRGGGGGGGGGRAPFVAQKPNPDDLRRVYRSVMSRMTGREIDPLKNEDAEKLFIDSYTNAVVGAQRAAYEGKEVTDPPSAETAAETQIEGSETSTEAEAFSISQFTDVLRNMMGA